MRILRRIGLNAKPVDRDYLASLGITVNIGVTAFEIDETDSRWPEIEAWAAKRTTVITVRTEFTIDEISRADSLWITANNHKEYPQPKASYHEKTYDLSNYCYSCGIGKIQKAPFVLSGEPKWGNDNILQLNWVFDEYFVKPEIWQAVFEPLGIKQRVVLGQSGEILSSVVQLIVDEQISVAVNPDTGNLCPDCNRTKYTPHTRGMFPQLLEIPRGHFVKTEQYFGTDGINAWQSIIGSQSLIRALTNSKISGIGFWPVKNSSSKIF